MPRSGTERLSPWNALTEKNSIWIDTDGGGRHFTGDKIYPAVSVWYAASGRREPDYSGVDFLAVALVAWSSSPGFYFRFDGSTVTPSTPTGQRSVGYSVRCIRE